MSPVIQPAAPEDTAEILVLQRLAYQMEATLYGNDIPPLRQSADELRDEIAGGIVLKLVEDGRILGSVRAIVAGHTGHIGRLIVHPEAQRRGFGTMLMATIESRCLACLRFELFTGHRSTGNLRLYQRLGYREFRRNTIDPQLTFVFLEKTA